MSVIEYPRNTSEQLVQTADICYDLSPEEQSYLTAKLVQQFEIKLPEGQSFACLQVEGSSEYANLARTVEAIVFQNDLDDSTEEVAYDYSPYDDASMFYLVVDVKKMQPVGAMRIIENSPKGFMTINELEGVAHSNDVTTNATFNKEQFYADYGVDPNKTWEIGTIAILPQNRREAQSGSLNVVPETPEEKAIQQLNEYVVSGLLYRALYTGLKANEMKHFISTIETKTHRKLRSMGIPLYGIYDTPPKFYHNGKVCYTPLIANFDDVTPEMYGTVEWQIKKAQALLEQAQATGDTEAIQLAKEKVKRAIGKRAMVAEILTGTFLDQLFVNTDK